MSRLAAQFRATARVVSESAAILRRSFGGIRARHADFERKPLIQRIHGPVAAERYPGACFCQQACGFEDLHALRSEVVLDAECVARRLLPLK